MPLSIVDELVIAMEHARQGANYCCRGLLESTPDGPGIELDGFGQLPLPLRPKHVREMIAFAETAPYGKGTRTLVDLSVRNSLEINASKLALSDEWNAAVGEAARQSAQALGLPDDCIQAKLYKLLIYQKGGFFLPHRDSEKRKNMVASMVVMLPCKFDGGQLTVSHAESSQRFSFKNAAAGQQCEYVSFYADCLHEVRRVERGVRVCLSYNLFLKPKRSSAKKKSHAALSTAISSWIRTRPADPIVFALDHQYTASGLKQKLLKGSDRDLGEQVVAAAEETDCHIHMGQVSRHLMQFADEGSYGRGRPFSWGNVKIADLEIGESYEDEVIIDGWRNMSGTKARLEPMKLDGSMLISRTPLDEWKPTSFDYEGYTGNAGNTLDRWYHKSAILVWPRSHHYEVLVRMGLHGSIDAFLQMLDEFVNSRNEAAGDRNRNDCVVFAAAIIDAWPQRLHGYYESSKEQLPWLEKFATALPKLKEREIIERFLLQLAVTDWCLKLDRVIVDGCKHLGADEMFGIMQRYLMTEPQPNQYGVRLASGLPFRDAAWLLKVASSRSRAGLDVQQLSELDQAMVARLAVEVTRAANDRYSRQPDRFVPTLVTLMKAAIAMQDDTAFQHCLALRRSADAFFDQRKFDVDVCTDLVAWSDKRSPNRSVSLQGWLDETRRFLEAATATEPVLPRNFARPAAVSCDCRLCAELQDFLIDAESETGEIRAFKADLEHVQGQIQHDQLDAVTKLDRSTRPFTLRLQKTLGSHDRAVNQCHADRKRLTALPGSAPA
ncbi:MAG: putative 2-oxoglutarate/Fe(II)-dependent dioxygenase YbiX [Planctomycetaceae bacterium]|jgi:predicted 2-oxoglutarate/Fe(II)-dependent dioxygenase YbiX